MPKKKNPKSLQLLNPADLITLQDLHETLDDLRRRLGSIDRVAALKAPEMWDMVNQFDESDILSDTFAISNSLEMAEILDIFALAEFEFVTHQHLCAALCIAAAIVLYHTA